MHLLLVLMVVIWGANYSLIKVVLRELPPPVFNALRLLVASGVFLIGGVDAGVAILRGKSSDEEVPI